MSEWSGFHKRGLTSHRDIQSYIEQLEQRLADAESELDDLDRELFILAHDVMCFENEKIPNWLVVKARATYCRTRFWKGE